MKEILFHIGPVPIYGYGTMIAIGVILAFWVAERREKRFPDYEKDKVFDLGIWALVGGILGAKLLFWITEFPSVLADPSFLLSTLSSGFVVYGGLIGGILSACLYCRIKKLSFLMYLDLVLPSVALAQCFGRLGCFLAGCCYGREAAWGVVFPASSYAPAGVALIPTQLISAGADLLNFAVLSLFLFRRKRKGETGAMFLLFYSTGRFFLEFLRNDPRGSVGPLSTSQFIAVLIFLIGLMLLLGVAGKKQKGRIDKKMSL